MAMASTKLKKTITETAFLRTIQLILGKDIESKNQKHKKQLFVSKKRN
jgi:hypothetical protein